MRHEQLTAPAVRALDQVADDAAAAQPPGSGRQAAGLRVRPARARRVRRPAAASTSLELDQVLELELVRDEHLVHDSCADARARPEQR